MFAAAAMPDFETAAARVRRLTALLRELTEIGMQLVRALRDELNGPGGPGLDAITKFTRLAAAIRRLIALEARLGQALDDVAAGRWDDAVVARGLRALALEDEAIETIEEALDDIGETESVLQIRERLCDWQENRSAEADFAATPTVEIIVRARRDLGLAPDPALLADPAMSLTVAQTVDAYAKAIATRLLSAIPDGARSANDPGSGISDRSAAPSPSG